MENVTYQRSCIVADYRVTQSDNGYKIALEPCQWLADYMPELLASYPTNEEAIEAIDSHKKETIATFNKRAR